MEQIYEVQHDGDVVEVLTNTSDVSFVCVMRLQCVDGEIQLFSASYNEQVYDSFQNIAKSYISEKMVFQTVGEIIDSVENSPYSKIDAATQTDQDIDKNYNDQSNTKDSVSEQPDNSIEIVDEINSIMNDEEFMDFLHQSDDEAEVDIVYGKDDIRADDLVKFVQETYNNENIEDNAVTTGLAKFADCPYKCGYCEKTFTRQAYLESHVTVIHGNADKDCFKCSYCDKAFEHKASLKKHFVTHIVDKPFKCRNHCNLTFGSKKQLQRHILIYKGIHSHLCKYCGKTWATKGGLKGHMVVHSAERGYQCNNCGKSFARKSQLTRHCLLHQNDRKYVCPLCGKTFLRAHDLTRHSNVHDINQARPYTCNLCEKMFTKKGHLNRHKTVHYNTI